MTVRIHLVRHATSESNLDIDVMKRKPDHAIELAAHGHDQALEAGRMLARHIHEAPGMHRRRVGFHVSPYLRARQTMEGFRTAFGRMGLEPTVVEEGLLREQGFGLWDGYSSDEIEKEYPREKTHYDKHVRFEGEHWAQMPLGESRAMVCDRVRGCFDPITRCMTGPEAVTDAVLFSHGITITCFLKEWLRQPWEWLGEIGPLPNCSVTTLEGEVGGRWTMTTTFAGFDVHAGPRQEHREEGHV